MYNWITRRIVSRTEGSNYPTRAAQTVDAVVAKWIPVTAGLLACFVTPSRGTLDSRYYESPNYPVRAVQTVDATVRTWIPSFDQELQSYRTDARPPLDVRRYEWSPEAFDLVTRVDQQVRTWQPAIRAALDSTRTPGRRPLDVRSYAWGEGWVPQQQQQTFPPSVAQTLPAFQDEGTRTAGRSAYERTGPQPVFTATLPAFVPWSDKGARTAAAPSLDVRRYDWVTDASAWKPQTVDPLIAQWAPFFSGGARTDAARALDVRAYSWDAGWTPQPPPAATPGGSGPSAARGSQGWFLRRVYERTSGPQQVFTATLPATTPTVGQTWPAFQSDGRRTADRARLDLRGYEWAPEFGWIAAAQPAPSATVAQIVPALVNASGRTADKPRGDLFRAQSIPDLFGVPDDWITWVPLQATGGRTSDRDRLDVRRYDWGTATFTAVLPVPPTVAQTWPACQIPGVRTADRARLDVRGHEWSSQAWISTSVPVLSIAPFVDMGGRMRAAGALDVRAYEWSSLAWITANLPAPGAPTVAQTAPAWVDTGRRIADRDRLDVRRYDWATSGWLTLGPVVTVPQTVAVWADTGGRTADHARLDVRGAEWGSLAWITANIVVPPTVAQTAATWQDTGGRTADRVRLDVRASDWSNLAGRSFVFAPTVAQTLPAFQFQSHRTADRPRLDVRVYDWAPETGWVTNVALAPVASWAPVFLAQQSGQTPRRDMPAQPSVSAFLLNGPPILAQAVTYFSVVAVSRWMDAGATSRWFDADDAGRWFEVIP